MPNWCENEVVASKKVLDFMKSDKSEFDFENLIKMPKELVDTESPASFKNNELIEKYGSDNWYDWSLKNWGVKWNSEGAIRISDSVVIFDTAWSQPDELIKRLSEKFPEEEISITAYEGGMGFWFKDVYKNGDIIDGADYEWALTNPYEDDYPEIIEVNFNAEDPYVVVSPQEDFSLGLCKITSTTIERIEPTEVINNE